MRTKVWLIAVGFTGIVGSPADLRAQSAQQPATRSLLDELVGDWRMVGQVRGHPVTYDLVTRRILNGRFVELHMTDAGRPSQYEARVFIGEDTAARGVLVHWLDNTGAAYSVPHGKGMISADSVQFDIPYSDVTFRDTFVFSRANGTWTFRLEASDGRGGWKPFAAYELRRVEGPAGGGR